MTGDRPLTAAIEILTPNLRLRPIRLDDAGAMADLITPAISRWTASLPASLSAEEAADRIRPIVMAMDAGDDVTLAIERIETPGFIGWIGLRRLKERRRRANLGYWIGEAFHGRGYTREAARAFLSASWSLLDVDVIEAGAQPTNIASLAILRGLGMKPVGERMHFAPIRGREELCLYFEARRPGKPLTHRSISA